MVKGVFILFLLILSGSIVGTASVLRFHQVSPDGGFSVDGVSSICQDHTGCIWFSTFDNIYRYDGFNFQVLTDREDSEYYNLYGDVIKIYHTGSNDLLFAKPNGLWKFDYQQNQFEKLSIVDEKGRQLTTKPVYDICEFKDQLYLVVAQEVGLYDLKSGRFTPLKLNKGLFTPYSLKIDPYTNSLWLGSKYGGVYQFDEDIDSFKKMYLGEKEIIVDLEFTKNDIWIGFHDQGVHRITRRGRLVNKYIPQINNKDVRNGNVIRKILKDSQGNIWAGTMGGLAQYDIDSDTFQLIEMSDVNSQISIWELTTDNNNGIWVGTWSGGVYYASPYDNKILSIVKENRQQTLSHPYVSGFIKVNNSLLVSTDGGGVNCYDYQSLKVNNEGWEDLIERLKNTHVKDITIDNGYLWFCTYREGLIQYDIKTKKILNISSEDESKGMISDNIYAVLNDENGLWLGYLREGVQFYSYKTKRFISHKGNKNALERRTVVAMCHAKGGKLWIGTTTGLLLYCPASGEVLEYSLNTNTERLLVGNSVVSLFYDRSGKFWVGTKWGLYRYIDEKDKFDECKGKDGFQFGIVAGILEDESEVLWVGTNNGLVRYNPTTHDIRKYDKKEGLKSNICYPRATYHTNDGNMFYGTTNGFFCFKPNDFKSNPVPPVPLITKLKVATQSNDNDTNKKEEYFLPGKSDTIILDYDQSTFGLRFTATNYLYPEKTQFKYKLDGQDTEWVITDAKNNNVSYTSLGKGEYTFKLKASNNDGVWTEDATELYIVVRPAPWQTWWAYTLYALFIAFLLGLVLKIIEVREQDRSKIKIEKLEKEKVQEAYEMKLRFFTNISHEFRTPLTLITSPLEQLREKSQNSKGSDFLYDIILKNTNRLKGLITELLDYRRLDEGYTEFKFQTIELQPFLANICESFIIQAEKQQINYQLDLDGEVYCCFDPGNMEKVIVNLLSNAFKYSPKGETITCESKVLNEEVVISVTNTGVEIPPEEQKHVFEEFYQVKSDTAMMNGSGLGLAFSKKLVELNKGRIQLISKNEITKFHIYLPCTLNSIGKDDSEEKVIIGNPENQVSISDELYTDNNSDNNRPKKGIKLLIVEDNDDLRYYLSEYFSNNFKVYVAQNGKEAYEMSTDIVPDVIISDVKMPVMNGLELCDKLKGNVETSHIPIILLTSKVLINDKLEGIEKGADIYIEKPFNIKYLEANVHNLVTQRKKLKGVFASKYHQVDPSEIDSKDSDQEFLDKAVKVIEDNMKDEEFDVGVFVTEMNLGRTIVYQKVKSLTGMSVNEFIIHIRLKRAAQLLTHTDYNIGEISLKVGFNNQSYFTKCFKKQYGKTPKNFILEYNEKR